MSKRNFDEKNLIVEMYFGSKVYGTSTPQSDTDIKFIFLPEARDIILGNVTNVVTHTNKNDPKAKSGPNDIEYEGFSLQQFLHHVASGQTYALDMLFIPEHMIRKKGQHFHIWEMIQTNKSKLLSKKVQGFVGYCRGQASKYGVKAERMTTVSHAITIMDNINAEKLTFEIAETIVSCLIQSNCNPEFFGIVGVDNPRTGHKEQYLQICGRKSQFGTKFNDVRMMYKNVHQEYGKRTEEALRTNGKDCKALYHAIRVSNQAIELLKTGHITFPRPEADFLLNVRNNVFSIDYLNKRLDDGLKEIEQLLEVSTLLDNSDNEFIDNLVYDSYLSRIK